MHFIGGIRLEICIYQIGYNLLTAGPALLQRLSLKGELSAKLTEGSCILRSAYIKLSATF